jgi:hypothetical protein
MLKILAMFLIAPAMENALRPMTPEESEGLPRWMIILDQIAYCLYGVLPAAVIYGLLGLYAASRFFDWLHGVPG